MAPTAPTTQRTAATANLFTALDLPDFGAACYRDAVDVVLHSYWRSSCSHRVRLALAIKGVPHRVETVDLLRGDQRTDAFLAHNPMGYVPCLTVDGQTFTESVAIIELLEDLFPTPHLYPEDARHRARVRAMVETVTSGIQPFQNLRVLQRVSTSQDERAAWAREFNEHGLRTLEQLMTAHEAHGVARGPFAYGAELTAADVFLLPQVISARRFGVDLEQFPRVRAAADAFTDTSAARAAAPEAQPDAPR
jgi:maleylacetoacetate isomerase